MFRRLTLILLAIISVLGLTLGQLGFEDPEETQRHYYDCWAYINCVAEEGGEEQQKRDECLNVLEESDVESSMKSVKKDFYDIKSSSFSPLVGEFCHIESSERKPAFEKIVKGVANYYMITCSTPGRQKECERWGDATDCITPYLEELNSQKKCKLPE
ncbi:hypothetical protein TNCT_332011 [Trichonephila clavata]|uniref:Uncharacterized protein n=1 Tax=Trichonephila clavata TaxID=2740835 RepID=A0A8X6HDE7_TRICU|nr:hypothetical protein TNCT_332011 [Trichonephila clavata]